MNKLPGPLFKELMDALISAFPTYGQLEQMVRFQLDEELAQLTQNGTLTDIVFDLIEWAQSRSSVVRLVAGARKSNPQNSALINIEEKCKNLFGRENIYDNAHYHESIVAERLKDVLSDNEIQSVSLILEAPPSSAIEYSIFGKTIYLVSLLADTRENSIKPFDDHVVEPAEQEEIQYNHLNIYLPVQIFNISEHLSEEDEMFISGLVCYIDNCTTLTRFAIEKFGDFPAVFRNFVDLKELRILDCKNLKSLRWDIERLTNLQHLGIQDTGLDAFPISISKLSKLVSLDLSGNQLRSIPLETKNHPGLTELALLNNPLDDLPDELIQKAKSGSLHLEIDPQLEEKLQIRNRNSKNLSNTIKRESHWFKQISQILNWIFLIFPKVLGNLFFDIFGQHRPVDSSTIIVGYLLIFILAASAGLISTALILVLSGLLSPDTFWTIIEKILQLFFGK